MAEFEVNLTGLKGAVTKEENVIKSLQKEIERLDAVITSSALNQSGFGGILDALRTAATQLQDEKNGVEQLKNCLSDIITTYGEIEQNICENNTTDQKIKQSIENINKILDELLKKEKYGKNDNSSVMCGDPVNMSTGNFIYDHVDLKVAGGIPLYFRRYYNALDCKRGVIGVRFLHNYEVYLETKEEEDKIIICMGDGKRKSFVRIDEGYYVGERAVLETLYKEENGYRLKMVEGGHYYFNKNGVLIRIENQNKMGINFTYNKENGLLQKAETDNGSYLNYSYDEAGRLICVSDIEDRKIQLSYEEDNLTCVQMADGQKILYSYTADGQMETITNAEKVVILKNYYEKGQRIVRQELADGVSMIFEYDDVGRSTIMTERNGSKTVYVQDEKYRNTDIIYEDGSTEHFEYNERNQKIKAVNRNGHSCQMAYDRRGNLTQIVYESGMKINYTYDCNNKILCIKVNGKEKLHNTYDVNGNLLIATSADGIENKVTYDEMGKPIQIEMGKGNITQLAYDVNGNIEKIIDGCGNQMTYHYDKLGRAIETIDANGNKTFYEYDVRDRLTRVVNPLGLERLYYYNVCGKVVEMLDYDGYTIKATYNSFNKIECYTDKEGNETYFTYDEMRNVASRITPDGARYDYFYDKNNRLQYAYAPEDRKTIYTYDFVGNCTGITDAEGNHTVFSYDAVNQLKEIIEADGAKTIYFYDEDGNVKRVIDACGGEWHYTYDVMGRRNSMTDPLGNTTSVCYNKIGKIESICYPNGSNMKYSYRADGRLVGIVRPDGTSESYIYDGNGNLISKTNGRGDCTIMKYDCLNRLISETNPAGGVRLYSYDAIGHLTEVVDENGNHTKYEYSPNGNLIKVIDALGNKTNYRYDSTGRLIKTERIGEMKEEGQETLYRWNLAGDLEEVRDPLGNVEHYVYDKNGRMIEKIDKDGYKTSFGYDHYGKVTDIQYADDREVKLSYNALHQLEEVMDWIGKTSIQLDKMGRPLAVTDAMGQTVGYEWGSMGEKTALIYPDGKRAEYSYDEAMHLTTLHTGNELVSYQYDSMGRLTNKHLPGEITTRYTYNKLGRIAGIYHEGMIENESYQYIYDLAGNKTGTIKTRNSVEADSGNFGYTYDALNRLTEVTKNGEVLRQYSYDAFGNRSRKRDFTGDTLLETTYQYNRNNQLIAELEGTTETTYQYDLRGNLRAVSQGKKLLKQFTFDVTNRMTESVGMVDGILKKARYEYNGLGQRIGQNIWQIDEKLQRTAGFPSNQEQSIRYTLDMTRQFHNLLQLEETQSSKNQIFYWDRNVVSMEETGEKRFYLQDDLGTVMGLLDAEGYVCEAYDFDEFGVPKIVQDTNRAVSNGKKDVFYKATQPFGFTGYQMDMIGGLYFAHARNYDASVGRFTSKDSDKFLHFNRSETLNQYIYCLNNPVIYTDLSGNDCYIFYLPEWKNEAQNDQKQLAKQYGLKDSEVHLVEVTDNQSLADAWNAMGEENGKEVDIDAVVINTHANPYGLGFGDNSGDFFSGEQIQSLDNKDVGELVLYGCNAGHADYVGSNPASEFAQKVNGALVLASDGTVYSGITFFNLTKRKYKSKADKTFENYILGNERENKGWLIYQYNDEEVEVIAEIGKNKHLTDMLVAMSEHEIVCEESK